MYRIKTATLKRLIVRLQSDLEREKRDWAANNLRIEINHWTKVLNQRKIKNNEQITEKIQKIAANA